MKHSAIRLFRIGDGVKLKIIVADPDMDPPDNEMVMEGIVTMNEAIAQTLTLGNPFVDDLPFATQYVIDYDAILEDLTD